MIEDSFIESHVTRNGGKNIVARFFAVFALCIVIIAINFFGLAFFGGPALGVTLMFSVTLIFIFVFWLKRSYTEYDIEISNDNVNVAKILGQSSRVDLMDFSIKDCIYIGPVTDDRFKSDLEKADIKLAITEKKDYPIEDSVWYLLYKEENYNCMLILDFKPEMYKVFRRYNPRNVAFYRAPAKTEEKTGEKDA
jgi:hypothetical protein